MVDKTTFSNYNYNFFSIKILLKAYSAPGLNTDGGADVFKYTAYTDTNILIGIRWAGTPVCCLIISQA